jgi:hypothetical protein
LKELYIPKYFEKYACILSSDSEKTKCSIVCECSRESFDYYDLRFKRSYPEIEAIERNRKEIEEKVKQELGEQVFGWSIVNYKGTVYYVMDYYFEHLRHRELLVDGKFLKSKKCLGYFVKPNKGIINYLTSHIWSRINAIQDATSEMAKYNKKGAERKI